MPVNYVFYPAVAHILTPSVNLAFGPESGVTSKCRAWAGFGWLQIEARLQLLLAALLLYIFIKTCVLVLIKITYCSTHTTLNQY